jgi:hypothetical protein
MTVWGKSSIAANGEEQEAMASSGSCRRYLAIHAHTRKLLLDAKEGDEREDVVGRSCFGGVVE